MRIAFLGAGQMAEALLAGLIPVHNVVAADIDQQRLLYLSKKYKVKTTTNNLEAFQAAQVVVLAVKPQKMAEVLVGLKSGAKPSKADASKVIISIAAGVPLAYFKKYFRGLVVVRAMPNNPCLVRKGITALAFPKNVSRKIQALAKAIFENVGEVVVVQEKWMNAVTGLSGSGPAFVYECVESLAEGGIKAGLPKTLALRLALETVLGAASTAKTTAKSLTDLKAMVTSPGGTTFAGLKKLEEKEFRAILSHAVVAAADRAAELAKGN